MKTTTDTDQSSTTTITNLETEIEELEEIVAPKLAVNHNETFVRDEEFPLDV